MTSSRLEHPCTSICIIQKNIVFQFLLLKHIVSYWGLYLLMLCIKVDALVQLVKYHDWSWVGVIAGDDAYGRGGATIFANEVGAFFV